MNDTEILNDHLLSFDVYKQPGLSLDWKLLLSPEVARDYPQSGAHAAVDGSPSPVKASRN